MGKGSEEECLMSDVRYYMPFGRKGKYRRERRSRFAGQHSERREDMNYAGEITVELSFAFSAMHPRSGARVLCDTSLNARAA